ncbi:MAG: hypothetical protein CMG46_01715 [Candidatus Marinimicrobia bacterium]|nr:hypothetical protein [Candidatus Neomarinimicrobiota bacterium]
MSIKDKPLKKCHSDKRLTIDVIHDQKYKEFNDNEYNYTKYLNELNEIDNNIKHNKYTNSKLIEMYKRIDVLKGLISNCSKDNEYNYYFDNGDILNNYYKNKLEDTKNNKKTIINPNSNVNPKSILNFFKLDSSEENGGEGNDDESASKIVNDSMDDNYINLYLENIDDNFINPYNDETLYLCPNCNCKIFMNKFNSELLCTKCGYVDDILINTDNNTYKDVPREVSYFAYKRINHFNEWLAQFQAKETSEIPPEVYKSVLKELKKYKHIDIKDINYKLIRDILKKLKYNKYYEHIPSIISIISGKRAPMLYPKHEDILRHMFKEIQNPFMKHCPETRKNFLSYSYVLHKFCELLEFDDLLIYFPLLKSREKLQQQDTIWKNICNELNWEYIPSI